jgi:hypothetical protein
MPWGRTSGAAQPRPAPVSVGTPPLASLAGRWRSGAELSSSFVLESDEMGDDDALSVYHQHRQTNGEMVWFLHTDFLLTVEMWGEIE